MVGFLACSLTTLCHSAFPEQMRPRKKAGIFVLAWSLTPRKHAVSDPMKGEETPRRQRVNRGRMPSRSRAEASPRDRAAANPLFPDNSVPRNAWRLELAFFHGVVSEYDATRVLAGRSLHDGISRDTIDAPGPRSVPRKPGGLAAQDLIEIGSLATCPAIFLCRHYRLLSSG